jgi:AraC-like DNA-binding protein
LEPALVGAAAADIFGGREGAFELSRPVIGDAHVTELVHRLLDAETGQGEGLLCEELLVALVARAGGLRSHRTHRCAHSIALAKSRIDDDPAGPVTLATLAAMSAMSRFQLLRAFTQVTGLTPHAYLLQKRIDIVRRLILEGTPLAAAAAAGGFSDQSHMTRTFVKKYGVRPGAFARAMHASPGASATVASWQ